MQAITVLFIIYMLYSYIIFFFTAVVGIFRKIWNRRHNKKYVVILWPKKRKAFNILNMMFAIFCSWFPFFPLPPYFYSSSFSILIFALLDWFLCSISFGPPFCWFLIGLGQQEEVAENQEDDRSSRCGPHPPRHSPVGPDCTQLTSQAPQQNSSSAARSYGVWELLLPVVPSEMQQLFFPVVASWEVPHCPL